MLPHRRIRQIILKAFSCLSLIINTGCWSIVNTDIVNESNGAVIVKMLRKPPTKDSILSKFYNNRYFITETRLLSPKDGCTIGSTTAYFWRNAPFDWDTVIINADQPRQTIITASSVNRFVTDTSEGTHGVEGPRSILYTIRLK